MSRSEYPDLKIRNCLGLILGLFIGLVEIVLTVYYFSFYYKQEIVYFLFLRPVATFLTENQVQFIIRRGLRHPFLSFLRLDQRFRIITELLIGSLAYFLFILSSFLVLGLFFVYRFYSFLVFLYSSSNISTNN